MTGTNVFELTDGPAIVEHVAAISRRVLGR